MLDANSVRVQTFRPAFRSGVAGPRPGPSHGAEKSSSQIGREGLQHRFENVALQHACAALPRSTVSCHAGADCLESAITIAWNAHRPPGLLAAGHSIPTPVGRRGQRGGSLSVGSHPNQASRSCLYPARSPLSVLVRRDLCLPSLSMDLASCLCSASMDRRRAKNQLRACPKGRPNG
jgi:hypothetical protein